MVPAISKGGRTFKAAALYFLHDKSVAGQGRSLSADRVAWTETCNLPTDDPHRAWKMMIDTAESQGDLKQAAGIKATGRKLERPTFAYSLAWHPDERPSRAEMVEAAHQSLKTLGLERHQALIVSHTDAPHAHVHILVNRVDPSTGLAATLSRSKLKLSQWAQAYEEGRGRVFCPERVENNERRYGQQKARAVANRIFRLTIPELAAGIRDRKIRPTRRLEHAERFSTQAGQERQGQRRRRAENDNFHQGRREIRAATRDRDRQARTIVQKPEKARESQRLSEALAKGHSDAAFAALTHNSSTFTRSQLVKLIGAHTATDAAFRVALETTEQSPNLVRLGADAKGQDRFTSRQHQDLEQRMERHARLLHGQKGPHRDVSPRWAGKKLSADQDEALRHVLAAPRLAAVIGYAGTGKSTMLDAARESWEKAGYTVKGAALSGIAADGLKNGAGIDSKTIHSRLYQWDQGQNLLTNKDVLVIDEAGMIGSRQMEKLLSHAAQAKAKVVLVGDYEQLQAIEAGGAFKSIVDRIGAAQINTVRRQREDWQKDATKELATGQTEAALKRYSDHGMIRGHERQTEAMGAVIQSWRENRDMRPGQSQIILAFRNQDVAELNGLARATLREQRALGKDVKLQTGQGEREFATQDRIYFLRNNSELGVRNGSLGTIERIQGDRLTVKMDGEEGRSVTFAMGDYNAIAHGYAATVHKSQGVTVDRAYLLASRNLDRHSAYVAMTRHRDRLDVHWSKEEFGTEQKFTKTMTREARKDTTLDYGNEAAMARAARTQAAQDMRDRVDRRAENFASREATPAGRMANARSLAGSDASMIDVARLALNNRARTKQFKQQQGTLKRWTRQLDKAGAGQGKAAAAAPIPDRATALKALAKGFQPEIQAMKQRHGAERSTEDTGRRTLEKLAARNWANDRQQSLTIQPGRSIGQGRSISADYARPVARPVPPPPPRPR